MLEVLKGVERIGGAAVSQKRPAMVDGAFDWDLFDELRKESPIFVDQDTNMISFRMQKGYDQVNGCGVDVLVETARQIIKKLNHIKPNQYLEATVKGLNDALHSLWQARDFDHDEAVMQRVVDAAKPATADHVVVLVGDQKETEKKVKKPKKKKKNA